MRYTIALIFLLSFGFLKAQEVNIIPQPVKIKMGNGNFTLNNKTKICILSNNPNSKPSSVEFEANYLKQYIKRYYSLDLAIKEINLQKSDTTNLNLILIVRYSDFKSDRVLQSDREGYYNLTINRNAISIVGRNEGTFFGIQTLIQLLPVPNIQHPTSNNKLLIPQLTITDYPRFAYRGMHLDCGRHFWSVDFIKKYIDYLALHKFNKFHWHLTEDQGWRIEIKKYPALTAVGSRRNGTIIGRYPGTGNDNIPYGGYYTQEQIKEVVKYAQERYIDVIPEIEMPGHSSAAIAAYPELSCFPDKPTEIPATMISKQSKGELERGRVKLVQETWGVFDDVFCAGKENTFKFLEDVMDEVLALFPSKYVHVGGDECPKVHWKKCPACQQRMKDNGLKDEHELQSYFIQRMEKYLNKKGRTLIGWDEILEGGLAPNAVVMSWRGEQGGIDAAKQNHDVIMTPGNPVYFDHTQNQNEDSVTIGGYNPIEKVYAYEPIPKELNAEQAKYVLGAQANMWTEYMGNTRKVEYMLFPRLSALSEVLWSPKENRDWKDFEKRLMGQFKRYDLWKTNYSKSYFDLKATVLPGKNNIGVVWKLESNNPDTKIQYNKELDITDPPNPPAFHNYNSPIQIVKSGTYYGWSIVNGKRVNDNIVQKFSFNKATGKKITLTNPASDKYPGDGAFTLVNGVINEKGFARSREFLGFSGTNCEAIIDLGILEPISFVVVNTLNRTSSWIWRPLTTEVFGSGDGINWYSLKLTDDYEETKDGTGKGKMTMSFKATYARYVKVVVTNWGTIPAGNPGAGNKPWLFVDEIEVN